MGAVPPLEVIRTRDTLFFLSILSVNHVKREVSSCFGVHCTYLEILLKDCYTERSMSCHSWSRTDQMWLTCLLCGAWYWCSPCCDFWVSYSPFCNSSLQGRVVRRLRDVPKGAVGHVYVPTGRFLSHFALVNWRSGNAEGFDISKSSK